ncbi:hypothetical protein D0864_05825 [Hortaea werneckii]|uniref:AB hydrolase-1 domain-containing protein n=1 Tax=Hortaea werneckii TaxID=91943 RepID=A0A3M7FYY2_HORWE|nr:hypothetical protein D0864_05825 [Hortaea werneckii]RMY94098.1 hypothetical protein D0862_09048 [Hortaea werneckii]
MFARRLALPRNLQVPRGAFLAATRRPFSSTELPNGIKLAYDLYEPPEKKDSKSQDAPIVFIHGLFGSKKNNRSMSRVFARDLNRSVYAIDLRNHGDSSHDPRHDYTAMAEDVELFMQAHKLSNSCLIGHSMGAKAAMAVALRHKVEVGSLIPVDNAPVDAALKSDFGKYVQGMRKIQDARVTKQSEADAILSQYEPSLPIRQFLLTNLSRDQADGVQKWRIPIKTLGGSLDNMADFPFKDPDAAQYKGQTLIVRGTNSHYVADEMLPLVGRFFPAFKSVDIEAGHWLISEKPEEFRKEQLWSISFKTEIDSPSRLEPRVFARVHGVLRLAIKETQQLAGA